MKAKLYYMLQDCTEERFCVIKYISCEPVLINTSGKQSGFALKFQASSYTIKTKSADGARDQNLLINFR